MSYRVIYNAPDGINRVTSKEGSNLYTFDNIEAAKTAAGRYTKNNQLREGSFFVVDLTTNTVVSTFIFPPPPPLEGWVDAK